jgi:glyoxylase-like metal-dependent hydrolase (beta-lactamase superfamily II)
MKIIPLSEGAFTIDKTKQFVPFNEETDVLNERPVGSLLVEIQPFVVITSRDVLLLDTGLGFADTEAGSMQLLTNLEKAGVRPDSITKVLMSHLHKDHAGGLSIEGDHSRLTFPQATYFVRQQELRFAMEKDNPSFVQDEIRALQTASNVVLLEDDEGEIDGYIRYRHTGAHSPQHQVFWIREEGETVFFGGDDAPQLQQMRIRYKTKYDFDPEKAMNLRMEWYEQGCREGWTFLFYHDIKKPTYRHEG